jgi:proteasome maturation protein
MELKMVREGNWKPMCLGGGDRVHEDVLEGRDAEVAWEDVFRTKEELGVGEGEGMGLGLHAEMEARVKMNGW